MLHYGLFTWFSRKLLLNGWCWTTESSQHSLLSSSWISHVGLWITTALLHELPQHELLMLDYGIITTLSRELLLYELLILDYGMLTSLSREHLLHGSRCTMESSKHSHVNSSWIANVEIRNLHNIVRLTPMNESLMLDFGIITAFCRELLLDGSFWRILSA